jgi:PAS domain-containing protein
LAAAPVAVVSLLTLVEYTGGYDLWIDQFMIRDPSVAAGHIPMGRMAPNTAVALLLASLSLLLIDAPTSLRVPPAQLLAPIAALICFLAVLGYIYGVSSLLKIYVYSSIALHTATGIIVLCVGIVAARPGRGWVAIVASDGAGGIIARRLLPAVIIVPPLLGWLRLRGQVAGWYGTEFGLALFASSNVVVFSLLTLWLARELQRLDVRREQAATQRFHELFESTPDALIMVGAAGRIVHANMLAHELFGYPPGELTGLPVEQLLPPRIRHLSVEHHAAYRIANSRRMRAAC